MARSTLRSQNVQSTLGPDHFWKLRCRKSARRCGAKHISKSKCTKHTILGPLLEVEMSKKCTPLSREAHFKVKMLKAPAVRTTFGRSDVVNVAGARDCAPSQKWARREGFVAFPKTMAGVGHFKIICKHAFRLAGAVQETCSSEMLGGQGADFLIGVAFWSIRYVDFLRWFCVAGAALRMTWHLFFVAGAVLSTGGVEKSHNALVLGRQRCTQLSIFEGSLAELLRFWCCQVWTIKKSRRIVSFLTLSSSKIREVSQNCFVFDVVNFEKWRSLAELLRFWQRQVQKLRKCRRIAPFLMLSSSKPEDVSQNSFVFKLAERQVDR